MNEKNIENLTLESYENEFSFKENKSNLNISFNQNCFYFFHFFYGLLNLFNQSFLFRFFEFKNITRKNVSNFKIILEQIY